jgi:cardiolipin synthase
MSERPTLARFGLLVMLAILLAACAGNAKQAEELPKPDDAMGTPPLAAWFSPGRLVLDYSAGNLTTYLAAEWASDNLRTDHHNYRAAHLEAWDPDEGAALLPAQGKQVAKLMAEDEWTAVTLEVMQVLVPPDSRDVVTFYAQGRPILAYRDVDKRLHLTPQDTKSNQEAPTAKVVDEDRFAALAESVIRRRYPEDRDAPLLFPMGGRDEAFVLFHLPTRLSVFLVRPDSLGIEALGRSLGLGLRMTDAVILRSHLLSPITRPVSTVTQLLSYTWHTGLTLLPGHPGTREAAPAPVASGAGMDLEAFEARLDTLIPSPRQRGRVRFLIDGEAFFSALGQAIEAARTSIKVRVYIFGKDDVAMRIADQLKRRSETINVQVLLDYLGSLAAGSAQHGGPSAGESAGPIFDHLLADSKVRVRVSSNTWLTGDHTKTIIVDGSQAFIGGMNIDRQYRYDWHDMMAEVRGPIVRQLDADFDAQWTASGLGGDFARLTVPAAPSTTGEQLSTAADVDLRAIYTKPGQAQILRALLEAIRSARRYIYIQNPYVTDDDILAELIKARQRGVDVRLILPSRTDSGFMTSANLVAASVLHSNGVRIYSYPGMSHLKAALIDGWSCFGSANLDKLSLRLNLETNLASSDPGVANALLTQLFEPDFTRSRELDSPPTRGFGNYLVNVIADHL